ncbi:hypothetical protein ACVINZ_005764 [Mesorhizobium jarvisii]
MSRSKIVILTGAGISAESGVATFRDPDGVWAKFNLEDVATPEGFARDPAKVQDFYNMRRRQMDGVWAERARRRRLDDRTQPKVRRLGLQLRRTVGRTGDTSGAGFRGADSFGRRLTVRVASEIGAINIRVYRERNHDGQRKKFQSRQFIR